MPRKKLLLIIGLGLSALFIFSAALAGLIYGFLIPTLGFQRPPTPPELRQARIVVGEAFLARSQFLKTSQSRFPGTDPSDIGPLNDIAVGEFDPHPGLDVVVAGRFGAMVFNRGGLKQSKVSYDFVIEPLKLRPFSWPKRRTIIGVMQIIDIEGDGVCEYLSSGSMYGAAAFDHQGKRLWSLRGSTDYSLFIRDLTAGDLNGDGIAEFVAARNGIEAFNRNGKTLWHQQMQFSPYQLAVVDVDSDGKNEIVTIDARITIRDSTGNKLRSVELPVYAGRFFLCPQPGRKVPNILLVDDGYVWLIDFAGETVAKFTAPLSKFNDPHEEFGHVFTTSAYRAKGAWVKLLQDEPEYLAVITEFAAIDRSVLYVYSAAGVLVYQEVLPEESISIAVLPSEKSGEPSELLVGGSETVWRFRAK